MRECPHTDAIVTIADALDWDVADGLRHLQTCDDCRTRIDVLRTTRFTLVAAEAIDDATIARISAAVRAEAQDERARARTAQRWANALETLLAGISAPIVLISSGIQIGSVAAGALTFTLGATLLISGKRIRFHAA